MRDQAERLWGKEAYQSAIYSILGLQEIPHHLVKT